jgi:acyl-[acyl-carrier-protein]-phospholipid O-acyltransferase/long-chain-fatty-acid--[acyl-carrier-protein] ligase
MISLAAVEMLAGELWPQHLGAVVAVPDPRKGERLILATEKKDAARSELVAFAKERHAADLMIPSEIMIFDKLPVLGSGKVDLIALNKIVAERVAAKAEPMVRAAQ